MSWTTDLMTGVAEHLAAQGVGTWRPSGIYSASETGIIFRSVPQGPDRVVVLSPYPVEDDARLTDAIQGLQVISRATQDPREADALDDAVFNALQGLRGVVLGGVPVVLAWRQSGASLGQDGNQRWSLSSNYYLRVRRSAPLLED